MTTSHTKRRLNAHEASIALEEFRPALDKHGNPYPGVRVSDHGRVLRPNEPPPEHIENQTAYGEKDKYGSQYRAISLKRGAGAGSCVERVHDLVGRAFFGMPPTPQHTMNHAVGALKWWNAVRNLDGWASPSEQIAHVWSSGIRTSNTRKIDFAAAILIHQLARRGHTHEQIAVQFNVHRRTIGDVLSGKTHKDAARLFEIAVRNHARLNGSDLKW